MEGPPHPESARRADSGLSPAGRGEGKRPLFRPDVRVAAGAAGGRDHRGVAASAGRGGVHIGIDARGRAEHAVGLGELVAERFPGLAGRGAVRGGSQPIGWGAAGGALRGWRRGLLWRRRRGGRGLRDRAAGGGDQEARKNEVCRAHGTETRREGGLFPARSAM